MKRNSFFIFFISSYFSLSAQLKTIDSLTIKAEFLYNKEKYNDVINFVDQAKHNFKKELGLDSINHASLLFYKANSYYYINDYLKSVTILNNVINLSPTSNEGLTLRGKAYYEKAFSQYALEDFFESAKSLKTAESILSKIPNTDYDYLLTLYAELGSDLSYLGEYKQALFYLDKGLTLLKTIPNKNTLPKPKTYYATHLHYKYISTYHNALIPNSKLKNLNVKKLIKHLKSIKLLRLKSDFTAYEEYKYAVSLNLVGDFYINGKNKYNKENIKNAHKYIDNALAILDKKKYADTYIEFLFNKSKTYLYEKKYQSALNSIDTIFSLIEKDDERTPFFYAQKGRILLEINNTKLAIEAFFKMASEIHSDSIPLQKDSKKFKPSNILNESELLSGIADESIKKNKDLATDLAYLYELALIQFKHNYKASPFNFKLKNYYEKAVKGILKTNPFKYGKTSDDLPNLINDIENIESKLAIREFLSNRKQASISIPNTILKKEMLLRKQLTNAIKTNKKDDIYSAKTELDNYLIYLEKEYPTFTEIMHTNFNIETYQKELPLNSIVLRYLKTKDFYYVFIITKNDISQIKLNKTITIDTYINDYLTTIKSKKEDKILANTIFKTLVPNKLLKNKNLIIIPDGKIQNLPFETLIHNNNYLIKTNKISYASHLAFATNSLHNKSALAEKNKISFLAFSPSYNLNQKNNKTIIRSTNYNLEGAQEESEIITKLFNGTNINNSLATKKNFIKQSKKANILHLSMHAIINGDNPELSHLLFTKTDSITDNKMYIEELYGLNLNADIAVLSACNTGIGISKNDNKGLISLHNAFTFAGVPTTLSSLWKVPDRATKQIMIDFYNNLKAGDSKNTALQKAKINYMNTVNDSNLNKPYFWAGFVLYGNLEAIEFQENFNTLYLFFGVFIAVFLFVSLVYLYSKNKLVFCKC